MKIFRSSSLKLFVVLFVSKFTKLFQWMTGLKLHMCKLRLTRALMYHEHWTFNNCDDDKSEGLSSL